MAYKLSRSNTSSRTRNTTAARGRKTASGGRLNRRKYAELLSDTLPRIIENEAELERVAQSVETLLDKGGRRTREEEALCRLLLRLIEDYQQKQRAIPKLTPNDALAALLEARNLRQADLLPIFGSRSRISDAVNGKREISKTHARKLAEFFSVSPELFI
jgi:HTH-type transcriptional regulator/antitoxin HigA